MTKQEISYPIYVISLTWGTQNKKVIACKNTEDEAKILCHKIAKHLTLKNTNSDFKFSTTLENENEWVINRRNKNLILSYDSPIGKIEYEEINFNDEEFEDYIKVEKET